MAEKSITTKLDDIDKSWKNIIERLERIERVQRVGITAESISLGDALDYVLTALEDNGITEEELDQFQSIANKYLAVTVDLYGNVIGEK